MQNWLVKKFIKEIHIMLNLAILALGFGVLGVSIGEGILVANVAKSAARQPEMFSKLQTLMFLGIAFIEGTFFVLLACTFFVTTR